ncbi:MAG: hypothetical protein ACKO2P_01545 [Planctomycetota bacterium]
MFSFLIQRPALFCSLLALTSVQDGRVQQSQKLNAISEVRIPATGVTDETAVRFEAVDLFVDSASQPLAAWQLELFSSTPGVEIVGIEGGDHPAFRNPPYYDPRAIRNKRVILGAFRVSNDDELPTGRQRVARVHVQVRGTDERVWTGRLTAAATSDGQPIFAGIEVEKSGG